MIEKLCHASKGALSVANSEGTRLKSHRVGAEHILLGIIADESNIPAQALLLTNTRPEILIKEAEKLIRATSDNVKFTNPNSEEPSEEIPYSQHVMQALEKANVYRRYFGQSQIHTEHMLLSIMDEKNTATARIFEEASANLTLLRRQVLSLMAKKASKNKSAPALKSALLKGVNELIEENAHAVLALTTLYTESRTGTIRLPNHREIVHMVMIGYLADFLIIQTSFQRYLLQEMLNALNVRAGALDQEIVTGIVANAAQTMREEVRSAIDHLWSHEFTLYRQMLDEGDHDLIGSALEDLWWEQSEELALQKLFDEALVDHRRKQVLSLQKRRNEADVRLKKLQNRLRDTIQNCFTRHLKSA